MKKLLVLCSLVTIQTLYGDELGDILSDNKTLLFDYQMRSSELEGDLLVRSWLNPVRLEYSKHYTTHFGDSIIGLGSFTVSVDQPIFKSGGIYYGIKFAQAKRAVDVAEIKLQKRQMIGDAVSILFDLKKTKLEEKKLKYQIKNDIIDIRQKRDSYEAGLLDSSFLDQAILKRSQNETLLLQLELTYMELEQKFSLLSRKKPKNLRLPQLKLISKDQYSDENLELKRDKLHAEQSEYNEKVTWTKYMPTVSLRGQYVVEDINPLFFNPNLQQRYYNYGFSVSMPIDVNSLSDIEKSKVERLRAEVEVLDRQDTVAQEYNWIRNSLNILDKKITLARKDEKVYKNLYKLTKNLAEVGEKTDLDTSTMYNSLQIRKLDQIIYKIDKQVQLLKLYVRVENVL